jgi:hypothetical protein
MHNQIQTAASIVAHLSLPVLQPLLVEHTLRTTARTPTVEEMLPPFSGNVLNTSASDAYERTPVAAAAHTVIWPVDDRLPRPSANIAG